MIKQLAWNTFKNTGDINTYLELSQVKDIEKNEGLNLDGNSKSQRNNYN